MLTVVGNKKLNYINLQLSLKEFSCSVRCRLISSLLVSMCSANKKQHFKGSDLGMHSIRVADITDPTKKITRKASRLLQT